MSKNFLIVFKSSAQKELINEFEIDEELIALHSERNSVSPSIRLIPTDRNINKHIAQDIVEGFLTDQFSVIESKITESKYHYHIEVVFQLIFEDFIQVTLSGSNLFYKEGCVEYFYSIEGCFCKAFAHSLTQNINTDFSISITCEKSTKIR
ncbi:hypothetical protein GNP89_18840 [Aliivibrio fischeri]|uniref:hypothetical protein n=1 Tax=Aliivibrio fischeri TaxID=668 RepID=UPI0012D92CF1|nr:hypothetical protein [Aliivibrio fischeri]MUL04222.1 hypothetical protein [Aliivibrio fischeri]